MDYLDTLRLIVLNPEQFLKELEKEEKASPAVIFFIISAFLNSFFIILVYYMFFTGISFYLSRSSSSYFAMNLVGPLLIGTIILTILASIMWMLYVLIAHLFSYLLNRNIKFLRTFQVVAYSSITYFLFSLIPLFGLLSIFYTVYIVALGITRFHKLEMEKAVVAAIIPIFIGMLLLLLPFLLLTRYVF